MKPIIFSLFEDSEIGSKLHKLLNFELGIYNLRSFPDGETYIQIGSQLKDKHVIFITSLKQPNSKTLPLLFAAETARELGAKKITLIAPYLCYMRQDKTFKSGEGITSKYFGTLLSKYFDELITIDPHLHRYKTLRDIYSINSYVLHATDPIVSWIKANVVKPLIVGPDSESHSMIKVIAEKLNAPFLVANKIRKGDHEVEVTLDITHNFNGYTPILIDDIISTAGTMIKTIEQLKKSEMHAPICIGVHAIFAESSYENLLASGAQKIITCNTIKHITNEINVAPLIAKLFNSMHVL